MSMSIIIPSVLLLLTSTFNRPSSPNICLFQVVRKLVEAAAAQVDINRAEAAENLRLREASAAAWAARQAEAAAALEASEKARQSNLGQYILHELQPPLVTPEQIDAIKVEMTEARLAKANAEFEEAKVATAEKAKAEAEATNAEQAAKLEEDKAAALEAAKERGEEALPEDWAPEGGLPEPVNVEAFVAAAVEAVVRPEPAEVTVGDVLGALLDKAIITKDAIMQAMAVDALGEEAYFRVVQAQA